MDHVSHNLKTNKSSLPPSNLIPNYQLILQNIRELNKRMSVDEARDVMETAEKLEHAFAEHFTTVIHGDTYEEIYEKCKETIAEQAGPLIWVPTNEPI